MIGLRKAVSRDHYEHENSSPWNKPLVDPRLDAVKGVLGMLTDEGGRIFSSARLDEISKSILYWIDEVEK